MFDTTKYREPSFDECLQPGFEFEIAAWVPGGWVKGTYPSVLDKIHELDEFGNDYEQKLAHAIVRVAIQ